MRKLLLLVGLSAFTLSAVAAHPKKHRWLHKHYKQKTTRKKRHYRDGDIVNFYEPL